MAKHTLQGTIADRSVLLDGNYLSPKRSQKIYNHSPDGFMWEYGGSGPAQLALAILLELTDKETALKQHQDFKWKHIATLPKENFNIEFEY